MSLASNLAALARLLTAATSGIVNGPTPAPGDNSAALANTAWFKAEQATETVQGTAKVATQAITNAGTDDTTMVTPKKLRGGFAISPGSNGYIALPSWLGGLILQWGAVGSVGTGGATVTYPIAFPNNAFLTSPYVSVPNGPVTQYANTVSTPTPKSTIIFAVNTGSAAVGYLALGN